jgi:hypothetical protein
MSTKKGRLTLPWVGSIMLGLGLILASLSGLWVGRAWAEQNWLSWTVGGVSLLCGVFVVVAGVRLNTPPKEARQYEPPKQALPRRRDRAVPYLGELVVHKYQLVTEKQLQEALQQQRDRGGRLGQIMVAEGYLDYPTLSRILEDQLSYGDPWRKESGMSQMDAVAMSTK